MRRTAGREKEFIVGFHVSIAGGLSRSVDEAEALKATALQVFTRSPSVWWARPIDPAERAAFRARVWRSSLRFLAVHTPYLPNLGTTDEALHERSVATLIEELDRARALGAGCVVTHLGAHRGAGSTKGAERIVRAVRRALSATDRVDLLVETSAGAGTALGGAFEEIAAVVDAVADDRVGVCFDTCHVFAAGYDLRTPRAVEATLRRFDRLVGLRLLRLVHLNDSACELGARSDRHAHLGRGEIGAGLAALVRHPALTDVPFILETPKTLDGRRDADAVNLRWARDARRGEEGP